MALKGNLRDFSTTQLLNLINLARKTGTLTIQGGSDTAQMAFREGKLIRATLASEDHALADMLHKSGKISGKQAAALRARSGTIADKELGLLLINAGYVTQHDIIQSVKQATLDVIYKLFAWVDGMFRFEANKLPENKHILVPIDLDGVIMEGSRRARELEQLQHELPNLDMALKFTDRPDPRLRNANLSVDEWRVVSFINPKNTIGQIARANNMDETKIRRIVYGLMQAGLVDVIEPVQKPKVVEQRPMTPKAAAERRSLVNRLINRIRSL